MKRTGPDSFNSWMISVFCFFINMMLFGMSRLSGVLLVASISRFNVSRAKASLPYTFLSFVRNVSGPLVGFLGNRYGVRMITSIGCLLGAIGAGACFFAESIDVVIVMWGVILGLGFGLGSILLPVAINQHFDKQRATASGISFSGGCFSSFVLPPIVDILLNTYGLSGTFLFLSGFILNCVPAALLLRKPNLHMKTRQSECCQNASEWNTKKYSLVNMDDASEVSLKDKTDVNMRSKYEEESHDKYDPKEMSYMLENRLPPQSILSNTSFEMKSYYHLNVENNIVNSTGKSRNDSNIETWLGSFTVIFDPVFILIAIANSTYIFTFVTLVTVIVDFARDLNIKLSNEKYILMALSVGDIMGRLGLGWITDRGYMTTTAFAALCFACQGITTAALAWSNGFCLLLMLTIIYGVEEGGITIIFPIIIAQYVDLDKQTAAISSRHFLAGPLCLCIAPMIGYFRDGAGSYTFIFYVVALLSAACSLSIFLLPYVAKYKVRSSHQTK